MHEYLAELEHGVALSFAEPISSAIPKVCCGVYSIWQGARLIYVGHAGRAVATASQSRRTGLADRLHHHASGRRSGDQFCVYVADRLVLARLTSDEISAIAAGALRLDDRVKEFVRECLGYRYTITPTVEVARAVEEAARAGQLNAGPPFLNPLRQRSHSEAGKR